MPELLLYPLLVLVTSWSLAELAGAVALLTGLVRLAERPGTGPDALPGTTARVVRPAASGRPARVRCGGEMWYAEAREGPLAEGQRVRVAGLRGLVLLVEVA